MQGPEAECAECVMSGEVSVLVQRDRGGGSRGKLRVGKTFTLDRTQDGKLSALIVLKRSLWEGFREGREQRTSGEACCSDPGPGRLDLAAAAETMRSRQILETFRR